jgi:hypothetical protein
VDGSATPVMRSQLRAGAAEKETRSESDRWFGREREYVDALELERRVRLALETDHVGVWPDRAAADG